MNVRGIIATYRERNLIKISLYGKTCWQQAACLSHFFLLHLQTSIAEKGSDINGLGVVHPVCHYELRSKSHLAGSPDHQSSDVHILTQTHRTPYHGKQPFPVQHTLWNKTNLWKWITNIIQNKLRFAVSRRFSNSIWSHSCCFKNS